MTTIVGAVTAASMMLWALCAFAVDEPAWKVSRLSDRIYELTTDGGGYVVKVIASVGEDGILIVDSGQKGTAQALRQALQSLQDSPPAVIINTHSHIEHTGGNIVLGAGALIIAHENLGPRLRSGNFLFDEFPDEALPRITFSDSLKIRFNGEEIRLAAFPGAHDNSDIIVWFTASKIACVGALCNGRHFPSVDGQTGDVLRYAETAQRVIDFLPADVTVIPGHGEDCTLADFRAFHDMLVKTTEIVRAGLAEGKDAATLRREDALRDWAGFECSYVDKAAWIDYLAEGLSRPSLPVAKKKTLFEPIYYAMKEGGADAAIRRYEELKAGSRAEYRFDEETLVGIAYKLYSNERYPEAVRFFELAVAEYPDGDYITTCLNHIGNAYREMGEAALAEKSYRRTLEVDADNEYAKQRLAEMASEGPD
ncbi:MAG: MBL fold metallo-hydrolase [bacterium]